MYCSIPPPHLTLLGSVYPSGWLVVDIKTLYCTGNGYITNAVLYMVCANASSNTKAEVRQTLKCKHRSIMHVNTVLWCQWLYTKLMLTYTKLCLLFILCVYVCSHDSSEAYKILYIAFSPKIYIANQCWPLMKLVVKETMAKMAKMATQSRG